MFSLAIPAFHEEVSKMIGDTDPAIWRAYLRFHAVDSASPYLSQPFLDENFAFYNQTMRGQKEIKPRWKRVLASINNPAGEALGQMYVQVAFPAESKAKMEELVGNLRTSLKARIEKLDWMSPETKEKAIAKWNSFTPKIGYPDKWRSWEGLATSRDSYLGNIEAANEFNYKWNLSKIGKPVDKTEWGMSPQTINAYYNPLQNEIVFPAAILQPPFFDPNAPAEMNYGGIGAVIGHEMTHGYDDQGSRFGPTGKFENWWSDADSKGFKALTGKLVAQFDGYRTADGQKINGNHTLGENIADLGGLATAYDAMKKATEGTPDPMTDGLTRDQRFFLNWATVWRRNFTPEELKNRIATDEFGRHGEWYGWLQVYLPTLLVGSLPWTPMLLRWARGLPASLRAWRNRAARDADRASLLLALWVYVMYLAAGVKKHGVGGFLKASLFPPGVPAFLYVLLTPVELLQVFVIRPATLALRLTANMIAGHLMLVLCFGATEYFLVEAVPAMKAFGVLTFVSGFVMTLFEVFVAALQAYIFTVLAAVYLSLSIADEH